jgi:hypothetical protein
MHKVYEGPTCRIELQIHSDYSAELTVHSKVDPNRRPFHHTYEWHQRQLWLPDLYTMLEATGAEVISEDAA